MPIHVMEYIFSLKMSETESVLWRIGQCYLKTTSMTKSETVTGEISIEYIVF